MSSGGPSNVINNTITVDKDCTLPESFFDFTYVIKTSAGHGIVQGNKLSGAYYGYYSSSGATEFTNNEITGAHHGFISSGFEEIKGNTIKNCSGHGMILGGVRGPVHDNIIMDNDSAGIYILRNKEYNETKPVEIYRNTIKNNGWYDLVFADNTSENDTVIALKNVWDHESPQDILQYDILNLYPENAFINIDSFIIKPDIPVLSLPENVAVETDTSLTLSWQKSTGAELYKIEVSETPDFSSVFCEQDSIASLNFAINSLNFNTTYYWRCAAENLAGESEWSESWSFQTKVATGINDIPNSLDKYFHIYPNPVSDFFFIEMKLETASCDFKIIDIHGRVIRSQKSFSGKSIDATGLPAGIYYISLQSKNETYNTRFVKK